MPYHRVRMTTRPAAEADPAFSATPGMLRSGPSLMKGPTRRPSKLSAQPSKHVSHVANSWIG